jgi:hypothetical protein
VYVCVLFLPIYNKNKRIINGLYDEIINQDIKIQ